ncbi:MAG: alpha/beta hydrolase [Pseudomonadota bacterium]
MMQAPFHPDIAFGPDGGRAIWREASDGVQLRIGLWPAQGAPAGTVLLFPGRTEYIEKYGHVADHLTAAGYNVASIDWRGQGLSDRVMDDPYRGHVGDFADYQRDVDVLMEVVREEGLAGPFHLLAHSMGGCIGLRALLNGLPVASAVFSAPMWGIRIHPVMRRVAWVVSRVAARFGAGGTLAPGTQARSFILNDPFEDNTLTRDPDMWARMGDQIRAVPGFELGGPSLDWVRMAVDECKALAKLPAPPVPCLTFLGDGERIVDVPPIHQRMAHWPDGTLKVVPGGEHEVLMEVAAVREEVLTDITDFLATQS